MAKNLTQKILIDHLKNGNPIPGEEITIRVDQTLTQDSTGTMVYLQLAALPVDRIKTKLSVAYVDHNTLQTGFENADDHDFIKSACEAFGIQYVKPGGGICHQVHIERFSEPGMTLIGSDSHTPTSGGLGAIAIGAGGLDVAIGMATGEYTLKMPKVIGVELTGCLKGHASAKDVALTLLQKLSVKGGVDSVLEYHGPGVASLSVPQRATICNMGAEMGATTSVFPSDGNTAAFMESFGRGDAFKALSADDGASYDESITIDLGDIVPMIAKPHSPDNVVTAFELQEAGIKVDQVAIGSCTNGSFEDIQKVADILSGKKVHPDVSLVISAGSANTMEKLAATGALSSLIASGARILESTCGPCIGMGQSPKSGGVSLRTFNRNFKGRSGTNDASVYLCSPETAAYSALSGYITSPMVVMDGTAAMLANASCDASQKSVSDVTPPVPTSLDAFLLVNGPTDAATRPALRMGPNIKPFPLQSKPGSDLTGTVVLKVGDGISTDDIMPSDASLLPYRSNVPHLAEYCFSKIDPAFPARAKATPGGLIVGGVNYGQGSSREHAALAPVQLGIRMVVAVSFARIHRSNLVNMGIIPLTFTNADDYEAIGQDDTFNLNGLAAILSSGSGDLVVNSAGGSAKTIPVTFKGSAAEGAMLLAGGRLNMICEEVSK